MGRVFSTYAPCVRNSTSAATVSVSSTGTSDIKTVTPPSEATACLLSCETSDGRFTCDGQTNPDGTHGHLLKSTATTPYFLPVAAQLRWASSTAGASLLQVTWLE